MKRKFIQTVIFSSLMLFLSISYSNATENSTRYNVVGTEMTDDDSVLAEKIANIRTTLIGRWENPFFALDNQPLSYGSLRYHFRENGTYLKTLGGAETRIEEEGTWEISEDGKHLLMRSKSLCDGQQVSVTQVATIKHLDLDELVLEQSICVDGVAVSAEPTDFYFNKY